MNNVAYIPDFHTSLVTLDLMLEEGYNWNPATGSVFKGTTTLFYTRRIHRQQIIEFNEVDPKMVQPAIQPALQPIETAATAFSSSSTPRPTHTAEADLWHQGLGHLNPVALEHLVEQTTGARIKGPIRIDCKACSMGKAERQVSRRNPQTRASRPFWRVHLDLFSLSPSINGYQTALLVKDEFTGIIEFYPLVDSRQDTILEALETFETRIQRQYSLRICKICKDNDRVLRINYSDWTKDKGIEDEPTAPRTAAQNGSAERSGGLIEAKARAMTLGANFPEGLWPESWKTAVYLHNRSHQQSRDRKTLFQQLHNWLKDNNRDTGHINQQPDVTHLKAYGCRAYPLAIEAQEGTQKRALKTAAHAEVGYLVGYDPSNIFRIWIPEKSQVRRLREVAFNERISYDPKDHPDAISIAIRPQQGQLPDHIETDSDDEEFDGTRPIQPEGLRPEETVDEGI
ncbi:hypothetical protein BFJ70_g16651 [Fusarium oxysporum]|nr:hypothetical protein BFJ70_g16651 [Fusarium oxysporum]